MSKLIKTDAEYSRWIQELKERYRRSQIKAAAQVNCEMLRFYWSLGRDIVARGAENVYGSGFYRNLSQDLKAAIPEAEGFSRQNLQYMKKMYLLYSELPTNCPQLVGNSQNVNSQQVVGKSADTTDNVIFSILKTCHMDREELKKLYNAPVNLRLKHIALCVIGMAIAILISMIFLVDKASWQLLAVMRGCAGVLAIIFVIIVTVLVYRVNNAYITKGRRNKKMKHLILAIMPCLPFSGLAHTTNNDSVKAQQLNEVVVEAQMQNLASAVSAYYPDGNQKKFCLKVAACSDPICL